MLKNNQVRREYIQNKGNWVYKDCLSTLGIRVMELKLSERISFIRFEKQLTEKEKTDRSSQCFIVLMLKLVIM